MAGCCSPKLRKAGSSFDLAFREEMAAVLPGHPLQALPRTHTLFHEPQNESAVKARNALAVQRGNQQELRRSCLGSN